VERLLAEGYDVRCILRQGSNHSWLNGLDIERIYGSYSDLELSEEAAKNVDITFHLAAASKARSMKEFRRINVEGTQNLVEAVSNTAPGSRFIFVSSQAASGPGTRDTPVNEDSPPKPVSDYGRSKLEAERLFTEGNPDLSWMILRPCSIYGPRETDILSYIRIVGRGLLARVGFGNKYINAMHISDLVDLLFMAARRDDCIGEVFFAAHPEVLEFGEFGAAIAQTLGKKSYMKLIVPVPLLRTAAVLAELGGSIAGETPAFNRDKVREMVQSHWTCDTTKAEEHLGFVAKTGIVDGMKSTISWYLENGWL
jgi:nucleoside-diphosphate-sugar epimerase